MFLNSIFFSFFLILTIIPVVLPSSLITKFLKTGLSKISLNPLSLSIPSLFKVLKFWSLSDVLIYKTKVTCWLHGAELGRYVSEFTDSSSVTPWAHVRARSRPHERQTFPAICAASASLHCSRAVYATIPIERHPRHPPAASTRPLLERGTACSQGACCCAACARICRMVLVVWKQKLKQQKFVNYLVVICW